MLQSREPEQVSKHRAPRPIIKTSFHKKRTSNIPAAKLLRKLPKEQVEDLSSGTDSVESDTEPELDDDTEDSVSIVTDDAKEGVISAKRKRDEEREEVVLFYFYLISLRS